MTTNTSTVSVIEPNKVGEAGEGGVLSVTNASFINAVFPSIPEHAFAAICSKAGDPSIGGWTAFRCDDNADKLLSSHNNFFNCSSFYPGEDGSFRAIKGKFAACHILMLDDIGTKVPLEILDEFKFSWLIETSPGNHQAGIILSEPILNGDVAVRLLNAIISAGLCDAGATGPLTRWARLPVGINGKPKHADDKGVAFECRLVSWNPELRYTPQEIVDGLQLELAPAGRPKRETKRDNDSLNPSNEADDVLTPKAAENPVVSALKARGLYKSPLGSGRHDMTCPWVQEHTDGADTGAAYFEPDELYPLGGFCCQHSHRERFHIRQLLEFLGVRNAEARHKPVIRIVAGDLHRVVDAAEKELANRGRYYQSGGLIVSVTTDPTTGDPSIVPTSAPALTRELSVAASWEKYDGRAEDWVRCDPPTRHAAILYDAQSFRHLPPLAGVVRQPYFRESDGELITQAGYDKTSQRFGVFDPRQFVISEPTFEAAQAALALLEELLTEFHFVAATDKAAALSAIFTAVVRPSLAYAPGYHIKAPVMGTGKSYLCDLIGAFAGPGGNAKVSYPKTSDEATKVILSLLLTGTAVIEFDDMDMDWLPHGTINRMLTADKITDRILGVSKTATVSTRTLILGSGNNVGPIRDLLRRVITIHLDPRCATPATLSYKGKPVDKIRKNRGIYVAAVLTIILAWRAAGSPKADVENIATFGGAWADYCRHPLMWLGLADPATALLEQVKHDPDGEALAGLLVEWHKEFGSIPTPVRKVLKVAQAKKSNLLDAIREFPIEEKGEINASKFGWILKKNADRVVNGYKIEASKADGRGAWKVVVITPPPSPALPPLAEATEKTVTAQQDVVEVEV